MRKAQLTIFTICCAMLLGACGKQAQETKYSNQEKNIENYIKTQTEKLPDARAVYQKGVTRLVLTEGDGLELTGRGSADIRYAGYIFDRGTINASTMFATNDRSIAESAGWTLSDSTAWTPMRVSLGDKRLVPGLSIGLEGMKKGEEAIILFSGKYGFGKGIGTIPADASLAYHVLIEEIEN